MLIVAAESDPNVGVDGVIHILDSWADKLKRRLDPKLEQPAETRAPSALVRLRGARLPGRAERLLQPRELAAPRGRADTPRRAAHAHDRLHGDRPASRRSVRRRRLPRPLPRLDPLSAGARLLDPRRRLPAHPAGGDERGTRVQGGPARVGDQVRHEPRPAPQPERCVLPRR